MKKIKYFFEFIIISLLFLVYKILGLKISSFISGKLFEFFGPLFRSKQIIKSNIQRAIPQINLEEINNIKKNKKQESYNLSEIVFSLENSDSLESKFKDLKKAINEKGFKNVATIYSISDTSKFGGDIGWIDESQLSKEILKEIKSIKIGQITKPISIPGGQLIIKVNEKKNKSLEFDPEGELRKRLVNEKNRQLSQFSSIYFNKVKYNMFINEL